MATVLIANGANPNCADECRSSPLHECAFQGHDSVLSYLLQCGADVNAKDEVGVSAMHRGAFSGHTKICTLLFEAGSEINCMEVDERDTPLDYCIRNNHYACITFLKSVGALTRDQLYERSCREIQKFWRARRQKQKKPKRTRGSSAVRNNDGKLKALEREKNDLLAKLEKSRRKVDALESFEKSANSVFSVVESTSASRLFDRRRSSSESALTHPIPTRLIKHQSKLSSDFLLEEEEVSTFHKSEGAGHERKRRKSSTRRGSRKGNSELGDSINEASPSRTKPRIDSADREREKNLNRGDEESNALSENPPAKTSRKSSREPSRLQKSIEVALVSPSESRDHRHRARPKTPSPPQSTPAINRSISQEMNFYDRLCE